MSFAGLFFSISQKSEPTPENNPAPIEIVRAAPRRAKKNVGEGSSGGGRGSIRELLPSPEGLARSDAEARARGNGIPESSLSKVRRGGYGAGDALEEIKNTKLYLYLKDAIDSVLDYPAELTELGETGLVRGNLTFTADGRFLKAKSEFESSSRYLRVGVRRILRHVFRKPLPVHFRLPKDGISVPLLFEFAIVTDNALPDADEREGLPISFLRVFRKKLPLQLVAVSAGGLPAVGGVLDLAAVAKQLFAAKDKRLLERYREDPDW